MPCLKRLTELRDQIKNCFKLRESYYGVENDMDIKLKMALEPIVKRLKLEKDLDKFGKLKPIRIRLAGDGTLVGSSFSYSFFYE